LLQPLLKILSQPGQPLRLGFLFAYPLLNGIA